MVEDPEADRLYALPLEEFTPARDALADRLRRAGDAEEAARIKRLRKPTTPAWVVNQLARRHRDHIEGLISANEALRRAQQDLLHGGEASDLWGATLTERDAVAALVREAEAILRDGGLGASRAILDRVAATLSAAASDPGGRTMLRRGSLTQEMRRSGFGEALGAAIEERSAEPRIRPAAKQRAEKAPRNGGASRRVATARDRLEAERESTRLAKQAQRLQGEAERAEKEYERAEREAAQARKRADAAEEAARSVRREMMAAQRAATDARRHAEKAAERLARIKKNGA